MFSETSGVAELGSSFRRLFGKEKSRRKPGESRGVAAMKKIEREGSAVRSDFFAK